MSTFDDEGAKSLREELEKIKGKRDALFVTLFALEITNEEARKILHQGVMRRISLIEVGIQNLFQVLPPETSEIPDKDTIDSATILLQANIFNTFGVLDCWGHVWAKEFNVVGKNGRELPSGEIGLSKRYKKLRTNFTDGLISYLTDREKWLEGLSNFRHALAHRIPPYIPPYMIDPSKEGEYQTLQIDLHNSLDPNERRRLDERILNISHFKAFLAHDLDRSQPIAFHPQSIVDFMTIEELSYQFCKEIRIKERSLKTS